LALSRQFRRSSKICRIRD